MSHKGQTTERHWEVLCYHTTTISLSNSRDQSQCHTIGRVADCRQTPIHWDYSHTEIRTQRHTRNWVVLKSQKVLFQRSIGKLKKISTQYEAEENWWKNLKIRKLKTDRIFQNGFVADYQGAGAGWRKQWQMPLQEVDVHPSKHALLTVKNHHNSSAQQLSKIEI